MKKRFPSWNILSVMGVNKDKTIYKNINLNIQAITLKLKVLFWLIKSDPFHVEIKLYIPVKIFHVFLGAYPSLSLYVCIHSHSLYIRVIVPI